MIIDAHSHLFPPAWRPHGRMPEDLFDPEALLARQDAAGVDASVVSDPHIWYGDLDLGDIARVREFNDHMAALETEHPGRIWGLATAYPWRGPEHVDEVVRAARELRLRGVAIPTSDRGQYLESVPADFWSAVTDLGLPVFVHPGGTTIGQELMAGYRMGEVCGRPLDMTASLARFILWGTAERFPAVRLLCAHAGGAICTVADRLDFGHELRGYAPLGPWGEVELPEPPSAYVRRLHLDTVTYGAGPLRLALETVGAEQICFGSDNPPVPFPLDRSIAVVDALGLEAPARARVMGDNTAALLGVDSATDRRPGRGQ